LFNAQSVVNKLLELQYIMYNFDYDCIFITESWLHDGIHNGIIDPGGLYTVIRKDRVRRVGVRGGGVCILIRRKYQVLPLMFDNEYPNVEIVGVTFLDFYPKLDVFTVYRPPKWDTDAKQYMQLVINCLTLCTSNANVHVVVGDFNLPHIKWNTLACSGSDAIENMFLEFVIQHPWSQLVDFPTRSQNVLDLVLTDDEHSVVQVARQLPIGGSDHNAVEILLSLTSRNSRPSRAYAESVTQNRKCLWHRADYDYIDECLSVVDWFNVLCHNPEVSQLWNAFSCILSLLVLLCPLHLAAIIANIKMSVRAARVMSVNASPLSVSCGKILLRDLGTLCCDKSTEIVCISIGVL